jgi:hypothetical protein
MARGFNYNFVTGIMHCSTYNTSIRKSQDDCLYMSRKIRNEMLQFQFLDVISDITNYLSMWLKNHY